MFVFLIVAGGLLFGFGGLIAITAIEFTSWGASWTEIKDALCRMAMRPRFWIGWSCFFIGFLMMFVPMVTAFNW